MSITLKNVIQIPNFVQLNSFVLLMPLPQHSSQFVLQVFRRIDKGLFFFQQDSSRKQLQIYQLDQLHYKQIIPFIATQRILI